MYITPEEFAARYGLGTSNAELREYEGLIRLAMERIDQYVGCPRDFECCQECDSCKCNSGCGTSSCSNCEDKSCFPNTFPRKQDKCPTNFVGEVVDTDPLPSGSIGDYWQANGAATVGGLVLTDGQFIVLSVDTNYPEDADFTIMDEVDSYICVIPNAVREAAFIEANRINSTGSAAAPGDCDCIKSISIGSVQITKKDSCDDTGSTPTGFESLLSGYVCWTYKMP